MPPDTDRTGANALTALLRQALILEPLRVQLIVRIAAGAALVTGIAMLFRIPLPAYMAYLVFVVSREDAPSTLVAALGGLLAATAAVAASMLLYLFDAGEPAVRIPLLVLSTFVASYLSRTTKLGSAAHLAGFVLVLTQTLADETANTEALTRSLLWLWVVVAIPAAVASLLALVAAPAPVRLIRERAAGLMRSLAAYIAHPEGSDPARLRDRLLALGEFSDVAMRHDKKSSALVPSAMCSAHFWALLLESLHIARGLPSHLPATARSHLARKVDGCRHALLGRDDRDPAIGEEPARYDVDHSEHRTDDERDPAYLALQAVLDRLACAAISPGPRGEADIGPAIARSADPSASRAHARFALKVACAVLASYLTYALLDWPGIRTAVTTCFFVSLGTIGESVHKLTLRMTGALIGGVLAGLFIVFVVPSLTDIGQLCAIVVAVSALCAWISTGSETIAYAGMQMAFAFFLGVMQGDGPAYDLTVLRDRVVGIAIGNVWMSVVFTTLWPISATERARQIWSLGLAKLGELMRYPEAPSSDRIRLDVFRYASQAERLHSRAIFERRPAARAPLESTARRFESIARCVSTILRLRPPGQPIGSRDEQIAQRIVDLSQGRPPTPACPQPAALSPVDRVRIQLDEEIARAARNS